MIRNPSLQTQNPQLYSRVRQPVRHKKKNQELQQATRAQFESKLQEMYMELPPPPAPSAPTVETTPPPSPEAGPHI